MGRQTAKDANYFGHLDRRAKKMGLFVKHLPRLIWYQGYVSQLILAIQKHWLVIHISDEKGVSQAKLNINYEHSIPTKDIIKIKRNVSKHSKSIGWLSRNSKSCIRQILFHWWLRFVINYRQQQRCGNSAKAFHKDVCGYYCTEKLKDLRTGYHHNNVEQIRIGSRVQKGSQHHWRS